MPDPLRPQLGDPHHFAYVVDDIAATVEQLAKQLGAGPFFVVEDVPLENVLSRDEPSHGLSYSGLLQRARRRVPRGVSCLDSGSSSASPAYS